MKFQQFVLKQERELCRVPVFSYSRISTNRIFYTV